MQKTALIPVADGIEEIEAVTLVDVLRRGGVQVTVASVGALEVTGAHAIQLKADCLIGDCTGHAYDLIALPGGLPGAEHLRDCKPLIKMLREQSSAGRLTAAICASPAVVLAHHGLLEDCKAVCYPSMMDRLPHRGRGRVAADGGYVTSQGPGTAMEMALDLVGRLCGAARAEETGSALLFRPPCD